MFNQGKDGCGLGLVILSRVVSVHNGDFLLQASPRRGLKAYIRLNLGKSSLFFLGIILSVGLMTAPNDHANKLDI